jgi:hypothetical protein
MCKLICLVSGIKGLPVVSKGKVDDKYFSDTTLRCDKRVEYSSEWMGIQSKYSRS